MREAPMDALAGWKQRPYTYEEITASCALQIVLFMNEAFRHAGEEAVLRRERAYGVYMGWRALVAENTDPARFFQDDRRLEELLRRTAMTIDSD